LEEDSHVAKGTFGSFARMLYSEDIGTWFFENITNFVPKNVNHDIILMFFYNTSFLDIFVLNF
jgi:hypothetical protein